METLNEKNNFQFFPLIVLQERDRQIELLRKENGHLQESLNEFVTKFIDIQSQSKQSANGGLVEAAEMQDDRINSLLHQERDHHQATINEIHQKHRAQMEELQNQNNLLLSQWQADQNRLEAIQLKYDNLVRLSETDQLRIHHLEAKVARLSLIVFPRDGVQTGGHNLHGSSSGSSTIMVKPSADTPLLPQSSTQVQQTTNHRLSSSSSASSLSTTKISSPSSVAATVQEPKTEVANNLDEDIHFLSTSIGNI